VNETVAQGFFLHFDDRNDSCHIGAAVIFKDDILAVAGFNGIMPSPVGQKLMQAASAAGVTVTIVHCDGPEKIVALTWGKIDPVSLWPVLAQGIAVSATKAFVNEAIECGMFPADFDTDQLDELLT
jgi:hypothetical protein